MTVGFCIRKRLNFVGMPNEINLKDVEKLTRKQVVNVALNLRTMRKQKSYTQLDLAVKLDCSESFVSALECGVYKDISLLILNKITSLFEISIEKLLSDP